MRIKGSWNCRFCCRASRSTPGPTDHVPVDQMQFMRFNGKEQQYGRSAAMALRIAGEESMAEISVRKGMPSVQLDQQEFKRRYLTRFYDPAFDALKPEIDRIADVAWKSYEDYNKSSAHPESRSRLRRSELRSRRRMAGGARSDRRRPQRQHEDPQAPRASCWSTARRAASTPAPARCRRPGGWSTMAREAIEQSCGFEVDILDLSRLTSEYGRVDPSVQVLRLDRDAAVSLAVQLLPELFARPGRRLDERDISAMGGGARRHDRHAGELVSGAGLAQGDDRPPGLRRRRQSRPDIDPRQGSAEGQGARAQGLALSAPSRRPRCFRSSCMAMPRAPKIAPHPGRLAAGHRPDPGRPARR